MAALLNLRMLGYLAGACAIALVLAFTYRAGKANVRADFDDYRLEQATQARKAEAESRAKEQELQATLTKAQDEASKREKILRSAAAGARTERDRLRDAIATATGGVLPSDTPSTVLARAATLGGLLDRCTTEYSTVAEHASGHASDAMMLRDGWPKVK